MRESFFDILCSFNDFVPTSSISQLIEIMKKKYFFLIALLFSLNAFISHSQNNKTGKTISNEFLKITFDDISKSINVFEFPSGNQFIKSGGFGELDSLLGITDTLNPVFGKGKNLVVKRMDKEELCLTLYSKIPFLFVTEIVKNTQPQNLEISSVVPFSFSIDLKKPLSDLKTLGTGGLLSPEKNPGSYVFLTTVDSKTRNGVVTGWLTNDRGNGVVFSEIKEGLIKIITRIDYGRLLILPAKTEKLETVVIGYFKDARIGQELFAELIAKNQKIKLRSRNAVYCTWYSDKFGGAGTEKSTKEISEFAKIKLKSFGLGVIQIDDQWQDGTYSNGPLRGFDRVKPDGPYPNGMTSTAKFITDCGFTAGIWWMPFARNHKDPEYKNRQDWFAHRKNGLPYETVWGGTSLDLTRPEVQEHISYMAKKIHGWGFNYFKMDGLWTGTVTEQIYINDGYKNDSMGNCMPLFDNSKTQIEAFRNGLKLIRRSVGPDVFFSGCNLSQNMRSFGASIGLVDAMRVGPDFNHDGQSIRTGVLRASRLYFLNGRIWWNDPDPSVIRESGVATADGNCKGVGSLTRSRLLPSWVAVTGQFFLSSDWLPDLPEDRIDIMKKCMRSHNGIARPVDIFEKTLPSIWLTSDTTSGVNRNVIGLFNWDTIPQTVGCNADYAGLNSKTTYYAFDFWDNKILPDIVGSFAYNLKAESCKIIAVRSRAGHPVLVSTSYYVTQGMIDVSEESWSNTTLTGKSELMAGVPYELRIAGLEDGGSWKISDLIISGKENGVSISALPQKENSWVRIVIQSKTDCKASWQIKFKK